MKSKTAICIGLFSVGTLAIALLWNSPAGGQQKDKEDPQALIKKGGYLVNEVARCGDCHTPRDARGKLDMTRHLEGAKMWFRPTVRVGEFEDRAPNITFTGKAGKWSEERMVKFLTSGRSDPPMPAYKLTNEDARAVTAYLRSLTGGAKDQKKRKQRRREKDDD